MLKPLEIANFFIKIANSENEGSITNMKLNKLLYFAQACSSPENAVCRFFHV